MYVCTYIHTYHSRGDAPEAVKRIENDANSHEDENAESLKESARASASYVLVLISLSFFRVLRVCMYIHTGRVFF